MRSNWNTAGVARSACGDGALVLFTDLHLHIVAMCLDGRPGAHWGTVEPSPVDAWWCS